MSVDGSFPTRPAAESLVRRLHLAGRRIESFSNYLDAQAAPLAADLLDIVADKIEQSILPGAGELDAQARAFGEPGTVAPRVMANCIKLREEAKHYRGGRCELALNRLQDYIEIS